MSVLIPRSRWEANYGAGPVLRLPVWRIIVHHLGHDGPPASATEAAEARFLRSVEQFHVETRGWLAVGYNAAVFRSGRLYSGRGWGRIGSHTSGLNAASFGLVCAWDGRFHAPGEVVVRSVRAMIREGIEEGHLDRAVSISGHRDHRATICPGDLVYEAMRDFAPLPPPDPHDPEYLPEIREPEVPAERLQLRELPGAFARRVRALLRW